MTKMTIGSEMEMKNGVELRKKKKKMERCGGLLLLVILAATWLIAPAFAVGGFAQIENVKVGEIRPGETFTVTFDVHNILNDKVRYIYAKAPVSTNFVPVGYDTWASGGEIDRDGRRQASFTFKADENLLAGVYSLPILLTSEAKTLGGVSISGGLVSSLQTLTTTEYVYLHVVGAPSLVLSQKSSLPSLVEAGKEITITFDVFNNGTDTARNVEISVDSPANVDVSSASKNVYVGEIAPKARATFSVGFVSDKVAGRTSFALPLQVSYDGGNFVQEETILLKRSAELEISQVEPVLVQGKNEQTLKILVKNTGNHDASGIKLSLLTNYPLTPSGRDSFISRLAPGESAEAIFTVDVDSKGAIQSYPIQLATTYDEHTDKKSDVLDASVAVGKGSDFSYYWLAIPVVFFIALFFIRAKKKGVKKE
jgi:hypothetical protein